MLEDFEVASNAPIYDITAADRSLHRSRLSTKHALRIVWKLEEWPKSSGYVRNTNQYPVTLYQ